MNEREREREKEREKEGDLGVKFDFGVAVVHNSNQEVNEHKIHHRPHNNGHDVRLVCLQLLEKGLECVMCCRVLQCVAACCSVLTMVTMFDSSVFSSSEKGWNEWCLTERCSVFQRVAVCGIVLTKVTIFVSPVCSSLKKSWNVWCATECYRVLHCVAACCIVCLCVNNGHDMS